MDFSLARYVDIKVFEFFRDQLRSLISEEELPVVTNGYQVDYSGLFFSPKPLALRRSFIIKGYSMPFVCLWREEPFKIMEGFYGRSVQRQSFIVPGVGNFSGRLETLQTSYSIYAESYYLTHVEQVAQDMLCLEVSRYVDFLLSEYIPGLKTTVVFKLESQTKEDKLDENTGARSFFIGSKFIFQISVPVLNTGKFIDVLRIYLNEKLIKEYAF